MESDNAEERDGDRIRLVCIINKIKLKLTRKNETMAFVSIEDITDTAEMLVFPSVLENSARELRDGAVVIVEGRISSAGEDEPKIICESIRNVADAVNVSQDNRLPDSQRPARTFSPDRYGGTVGGQAAVPSHEPEQRPSQSDASKKIRKGLYIKCASEQCSELERVKKLLRVFDGPVPVYVYFVGSGQLTCAPRSLWTAPNTVLIGELERLLGAANVKLVE